MNIVDQLITQEFLKSDGSKILCYSHNFKIVPNNINK